MVYGSTCPSMQCGKFDAEFLLSETFKPRLPIKFINCRVLKGCPKKPNKIRQPDFSLTIFKNNSVQLFELPSPF